MVKKKVSSSQSKKSSARYNFERETRVLLESIDSKVNLLAEQHGSIVKRLDGHDNRFDRIESELGSVKLAVMDNRRLIKVNASKIDLNAKKIDLNAKKIDQVENKLDRIDKKFDKKISNQDRRIRKVELSIK